MLRHSLTFAFLWSAAAAASMLALLADTRTAYATGMAVAAAFLALSAWFQSARFSAFIRRELTRFEHVVKVIDAPAIPSPRTVAYSAMGVAQEPLRVEAIPPAINRDLLAFVQLSIDAYGATSTRFLTNDLYKDKGISSLRRQKFMALLRHHAANHPYAHCVGVTLGELYEKIKRGEIT